MTPPVQKGGKIIVRLALEELDAIAAALTASKHAHSILPCGCHKRGCFGCLRDQAHRVIEAAVLNATERNA